MTNENATDETEQGIEQRIEQLETLRAIENVETFHHFLYGDVLDVVFSVEPTKQYLKRVDRSLLDVVERAEALAGYELRTFGVSAEGRPVGCYAPVETETDEEPNTSRDEQLGKEGSEGVVETVKDEFDELNDPLNSDSDESESSSEDEGEPDEEIEELDVPNESPIPTFRGADRIEEIADGVEDTQKRIVEGFVDVGAFDKVVHRPSGISSVSLAPELLDVIGEPELTSTIPPSEAIERIAALSDEEIDEIASLLEDDDEDSDDLEDETPEPSEEIEDLQRLDAVDESEAARLVEDGFSSVAEIAASSVEELHSDRGGFRSRSRTIKQQADRLQKEDVVEELSTFLSGLDYGGDPEKDAYALYTIDVETPEEITETSVEKIRAAIGVDTGAELVGKAFGELRDETRDSMPGVIDHPDGGVPLFRTDTDHVLDLPTPANDTHVGELDIDVPISQSETRRSIEQLARRRDRI